MKLQPQTALIHAPRKAPQLISSILPPIYRASTIIFNNTDALFNRHWTDDYDYSYGTHGTPTTYTLGDQIAQIEGGTYSLLAPSGLSAINLVNSCLLAQGDEVWVADNIYGPNMEHLQYLQELKFTTPPMLIALSQVQTANCFGSKLQVQLRLSFQTSLL